MLIRPDEPFGMLDIANYTHEDYVSVFGGQTESVAAHYDPGILSINVLSSAKGLQFLNSDQVWVDIPSDKALGVIWAGEMAKIITKEKVKPGWHRVQCYAKFPQRMSIWIEACTQQQELEYSMKILEKITNENQNEVSLPSVKQQYEFLLDGPKKIPPLDQLVVKKGQSLGALLADASKRYGIPMTKSITYYCPFCLSNVHSLVEHAKESHSNKLTFDEGAMVDDTRRW